MNTFKKQVFWNTTPCRLTYIYRRFGTWLHPSSDAEHEGSRSSGTSAFVIECWRLHSPEDFSLQQHCCENSKSLTNTFYEGQRGLYVQLHSTETNTSLLHKTMILFSDKQKDQFCGDTIAFLVSIITTYACISKNFEDVTAFKLVHSHKLMK